MILIFLLFESFTKCISTRMSLLESRDANIRSVEEDNAQNGEIDLEVILNC
jgi:hypothetical protein